jgi:hypothetical protein
VPRLFLYASASTLQMGVGTISFDTYQKESVYMARTVRFTDGQIAKAKAHAASTPPVDVDRRIEALVNELIGRVADKWTMLILEVLEER